MTDSRQMTRTAEVDLIRSFVPAGCKILEIGGGNGWQARQIASWGVEVHSIDVEQWSESYHPVVLYDGVNIPFPDSSFDLIFSSNVLEHVERRATLFQDMKRVLRPDGRMIHIVPAASWRFWTALAHYPHLVKRVVQVAVLARAEPTGAERAQTKRVQTKGLFSRYPARIFPVPHGIDASVGKELATFSRWGWRRCFEQAHLVIEAEFTTGIWYTGYRLTPWLRLGARRALARLLGSACHVFILRTN